MWVQGTVRGIQGSRYQVPRAGHKNTRQIRSYLKNNTRDYSIVILNLIQDLLRCHILIVFEDPESSSG